MSSGEEPHPQAAAPETGLPGSVALRLGRFHELLHTLTPVLCSGWPTEGEEKRQQEHPSAHRSSLSVQMIGRKQQERLQESLPHGEPPQ